MIEETEAEELAVSVIEKYIDSCNCATDDEVEMALTKLTSVNMQAITAVRGVDTAISICEDIANYLETERPSYTCEKSH